MIGEMKRRSCHVPNEGYGTGKAAKGPAPHRGVGTFCQLAKWASTGIRCGRITVAMFALLALLVAAVALSCTTENNGGATMPTHIPVTRTRTIEHLDSTSATHAADRKRAVEARAFMAERKEKRTDDRASEPLIYPSLGGGLLLLPDGRELSPADHKRLLIDAMSNRSFYWREEVRSDGRQRRRKRDTDGVRNLAITLRPEVAMLLAALDRDPRTRKLVRPFLVQIARDLAAEFSALTGLEVLTLEIHPEEGCLHMHLSYATVSSDNRLLWTDRSVGRKGIRCLGPWHIATLRLAVAGHVPREDAALAVADFHRVERMHGAPPVDWVLSESVDGLCAGFVDRHGLNSDFANISERYGREVRARRAQRPDQLRATAAQAVAEQKRLAEENATLSKQLRRAEEKVTALERSRFSMTKNTTKER